MEKINNLKKISNEIRKKIIQYSHFSKIPHLASCLSCVDILVSLYFSIAKINPKRPKLKSRDKIILSKGHAAPALFQILAYAGYFNEKIMYRPNHGGGLFGEHPPKPGLLAGIEAATGSLGHGLPMAVGFSLASKIKNLENHNYVIIGDGECNEGSIWEALMFSRSYNLYNLTIIVDSNGWQATGRTKEILNKTELSRKFLSFGLDTFSIDGHNFHELNKVLKIKSKYTKAIIAKTVKGKGVSFMEDDNNWHYRIPNEIEVKQSLDEIDNL